jgi:proteasome accessory factor A
MSSAQQSSFPQAEQPQSSVPTLPPGHLPSRIFGIETEYGFYIDGRDPGDLIREATACVNAYAGVWAGRWDYRREDPRADARGFRVAHLTPNPEDAKWEKPGEPQMPIDQVRADHVLANGARLYNDHGHPEYSTPECSTLRELVAHDKAGERIVLECARRYAQQAGGRFAIYKNNTDYHGISYGCHEDYLVRRDVPFERLIQALTPFLVTRQIYAGAGKVGVEQDGGAAGGTVYQLSQRADYVTELASVETLYRRPIINTRDEPHADPRLYRRFHVIVGDANMSEYATALRVGATALVLALVEDGWLPDIRLRNPVEAIKAISRDPSSRWVVELEDGRTTTALDIQYTYLDAARRTLAGMSPDADWTLAEWAATLEALGRDPLELADRLDWVAKRVLLETYQREEGVPWDDPVMTALDLEYHNVDPEQGLYYGLEQAGQVRRLVTDAEIQEAMLRPPLSTRAYVRGLCVERFHSYIRLVGWSRISLERDGHTATIDLSRLVDGEVAGLNERLARAGDLDEFLHLLREGRKRSRSAGH